MKLPAAPTVIKYFLAAAVLAALAVNPWPVARAFDTGRQGPAAKDISIIVAGTEERPAWRVFGSAIGGVSTGDLFYIDATKYPQSFRASLLLANASQLVSGYNYLVLRISVLVQSEDGQWLQAVDASGAVIKEAVITLQNSLLTYELPGGGQYNLTVSGGTYRASAGNGATVAPEFRVLVD